MAETDGPPDEQRDDRARQGAVPVPERDESVPAAHDPAETGRSLLPAEDEPAERSVARGPIPTFAPRPVTTPEESTDSAVDEVREDEQYASEPAEKASAVAAPEATSPGATTPGATTPATASVPATTQAATPVAATSAGAPIAGTAATSTAGAVTPPPAAPEEQRPIAAAEPDRPAPPARKSNRIAGTAWVLLAALLFEVVFLAAIALVALLAAGPSAVPTQVAATAQSPFGWLPVLFFFLFFELIVLLFHRAGRFFYVVASLVVGVIVYLLGLFLIPLLLFSGETFPDRATLLSFAFRPDFLAVGLVAREVMLWTGFAIGARGIRVRRRNRAARQEYESGVTDREHAAP